LFGGLEVVRIVVALVGLVPRLFGGLGLFVALVGQMVVRIVVALVGRIVVVRMAVGIVVALVVRMAVGIVVALVGRMAVGIVVVALVGRMAVVRRVVDHNLVGMTFLIVFVVEDF